MNAVTTLTALPTRSLRTPRSKNKKLNFNVVIYSLKEYDSSFYLAAGLRRSATNSRVYMSKPQDGAQNAMLSTILSNESSGRSA